MLPSTSTVQEGTGHSRCQNHAFALGVAAFISWKAYLIAFLLPYGSAPPSRSRMRAGKEKSEIVPTRKVEESRDRNRPLKVFVSERERAGIEMRAAATGMSVSAYLRNLGLGFRPHPTLDQAAALALIKVNADHGRLGGLFKLWLSGQSARGSRGNPEASHRHRGLSAETQGCYWSFAGLILFPSPQRVTCCSES